MRRAVHLRRASLGREVVLLRYASGAFLLTAKIGHAALLGPPFHFVIRLDLRLASISAFLAQFLARNSQQRARLPGVRGERHSRRQLFSRRVQPLGVSRPISRSWRGSACTLRRPQANNRSSLGLCSTIGDANVDGISAFFGTRSQ